MSEGSTTSLEDIEHLNQKELVNLTNKLLDKLSPDDLLLLTALKTSNIDLIKLKS